MKINLIFFIFIVEAFHEEENICVSIRVRPLNEKERKSQQLSAWKVLPNYNAITQITPDQKPIPNSTLSFGEWQVRFEVSHWNVNLFL